jgi:hypothetical protein
MNFPPSPTLNQTYTFGNRTWQFNGKAWVVVGNTQGYTGSSGAFASIGFTGSQSFTGSLGFTGSFGITGFVGSPGGFASVGFTGSGTGFTGSRSFVGSQGFFGSVGFTGSLAFTGSQGFTGSQSFTGSVGFQGSLGFAGSLGVSGFVGSMGITATTADLTATNSGATGTVTFDFTQGGVFYLTSPAANFTPNFNNIPTTNGVTTVVVLYIAQGATARTPTGIQINGVGQTIRWSQGVTAVGVANQTDMVSYSLVRLGGSWTVFGQFTTYV